MGGTMRLGISPVKLRHESNAYSAYLNEVIYERHRHRYEVNNQYREVFEKNGLVFSGTSPDNRLVEVTEYPDHPWFVASQYHPEFKSRPNRPPPLFKQFVMASLRDNGGEQS
jgi:CTP synthase